jgi:hypothetical protein
MQSLQAPAQAQADLAKLKARVVGSLATTKAHCQNIQLSEQLDRADQKKNSKKTMDLSRLQNKLGPKHVALIHALKDVDPESPHGRELAAIIESLDGSCD